MAVFPLQDPIEGEVSPQKPQSCRPGVCPCSSLCPPAWALGVLPAVQMPPQPRWVFLGNSHPLIYHQSHTDQVLGSLPSRETD